MNTSPFELRDLPIGWSVTWPDYEIAVADTAHKINNLLKILFEDFGQDLARLDVMRQGLDLPSTTFTIGRPEWHRAHDHQRSLCEHLARTYLIRGVQFHDHESAQAFQTHMEQRLAWRRLGGQWS